MLYPTENILAAKALNIDCGQQCINWALSMIEQGYDDKSLYMLACMQAPFNHFEIAELRDKVLIKFKIPDISLPTALHIYATETIKNALLGKVEFIHALHILNQLCIDNNYYRELYNFYLLYHAYIDLHQNEIQFYWDNATIDNIDEIIRKCFESFIAT